MTDSPLIKEMPVDQIDVWLVALKVKSTASIAGLRSILSEDEIVRADRFLQTGDSEDFVIARAALRQIVARYAGVQPEEIQFDYGEFGKPFLKRTPGVPGVFFNSTHSQGQAAIAVSHRSQLGIDLEFASRIASPDSLAKVVLSPAELRHYESIDSDDVRQRGRFVLRRWTMKEAFVKSTGLGLTQPLREIELSEIVSDLAVVNAKEAGVISLGPVSRHILTLRGNLQPEWIITERAFGLDGSLALAVCLSVSERPQSTLANANSREALSVSVQDWPGNL